MESSSLPLALIYLKNCAFLAQVLLPARTDGPCGPSALRISGSALRASRRCAGNQPVPEFVDLGVELKTLPVNRDGKPYESTYVGAVPLLDADELDWHSSSARRKQRRVRWVPILAEPDLEIRERVVGRSALWSPNEEQEAALRADWEAHIQAIREGAVDNIRGGDGSVLQVRPKAADSSQLTWGVDERGEAIMTAPRGFYLRSFFTHYVLLSNLAQHRRA